MLSSDFYDDKNDICNDILHDILFSLKHVLKYSKNAFSAEKKKEFQSFPKSFLDIAYTHIHIFITKMTFAMFFFVDLYFRTRLSKPIKI